MGGRGHGTKQPGWHFVGVWGGMVGVPSCYRPKVGLHPADCRVAWARGGAASGIIQGLSAHEVHTSKLSAPMHAGEGKRTGHDKPMKPRRC